MPTINLTSSANNATSGESNTLDSSSVSTSESVTILNIQDNRRGNEDDHNDCTEGAFTDPIDLIEPSSSHGCSQHSSEIAKNSVEGGMNDPCSAADSTKNASTTAVGATADLMLKWDHGEVPLYNHISKMTIGKKSKNDIIVRVSKVSRYHCYIENGIWLIDCNSKHGTTLNNVKIEKAKLKDGDRIGVGKFEFLVCRLKSEDET
eukprot:jgi/Bigna1/68519/fgenesh1_pg.6_\